VANFWGCALSQGAVVLLALQLGWQRIGIFWVWIISLLSHMFRLNHSKGSRMFALHIGVVLLCFLPPLGAYSQDCLLPVTIHGQGCLIDLHGKAILPRVPYRVSVPEGGAILAYSLDEHPYSRGFRHYHRPDFGLIDLEGKVVIPVIYPDGKGFGNGLFAFGDSLVTRMRPTRGEFTEPGRWRLANRQGFVLDEMAFDDVGHKVVAGLLAVRKEGKIGLVDSLGRLVHGCDLDQVIYNSGRDDVFWVRQSGQWFAVTGDASSQLLDWPEDLHLSYPCMRRDSACIDDQWMFEFWDGKDVSDQQIGCSDLEMRYWKVGKDHRLTSEREWHQDLLEDAGWWVKERDGERALADSLGNIVGDFAKQDFQYDANGFVLQIVRDGWGKYGLLDLKGNRILPSVHGQIRVDSASRTIVVANGIFEDSYAELWSFEGKLLLEADEIQDFEAGHCLARKWIADDLGRKLLVDGIIDSLGNWVYQDTVYHGLWGYDRGWVFLRRAEGAYGRSLKDDSLIGPYQVPAGMSVDLMRFLRAHPRLVGRGQVIEEVNPWLFQVGTKSGRFALYQRDGVCVLPKVGEFVGSTSDPDLLEVLCGRRACMVDRLGNVRVALGRQRLSVVDCGLICVRKMKKGKHVCGFVDAYGKLVVDFFEE
jgi:hypothetical protein